WAIRPCGKTSSDRTANVARGTRRSWAAASSASPWRKSTRVRLISAAPTRARRGVSGGCVGSGVAVGCGSEPGSAAGRGGAAGLRGGRVVPAAAGEPHDHGARSVLTVAEREGTAVRRFADSQPGWDGRPGEGWLARLLEVPATTVPVHEEGAIDFSRHADRPC